MISISRRKTTEEDVRQTGAWPSAPVFRGHFCGSPVRSDTLLDERGMLCAILRYGVETRSSGLDDCQYEKSRSLHFGTQFAPECHAAFRRRAVEFAVQWLRELYRPECFVSHVHSSDVDLLSIYQKLGFSIRLQSDERSLLELDDRPFQDATMPLQNGIAQYGGDPPFRRTLHAKAENGGYNVSLLTMSVHTGTHIDTPAHLGLDAAEPVDLSLLHGTVQLLDWQSPDPGAILSNRVLLARAKRGLTQNEAEALVRMGVLVVGIDRLSVGIPQEEWRVHHTLLRSGVVILENADLRRFPAGWYQMRCLPLSIPGSDGIPVRLMLREEHP